MYRCATRAPRVTRAGTYGPGRAPLKRVHQVTPDLIKHTQDCQRTLINYNRNYFIIIFIKNESAVQGWVRVRTLYQSENINPTQLMEGRRRRNCRRQKERAYYASKKLLALLIKPASPTPSNTWSLRSVHRDIKNAQSYSVMQFKKITLTFIIIEK